MSPYDPVSQMMLTGWAVPVNPAALSIPLRLHVVGTVLDINPLQVSTPGNNVATILPAGDSYTITQVTLGSASFVQRGDLVFLVPQAVTPQSLILNQLVLYKKVPRALFRPVN